MCYLLQHIIEPNSLSNFTRNKYFICKNIMLSFPDPSRESRMWLFIFLQQGSCVIFFIDYIFCQPSENSCLFCEIQHFLRNSYVREIDCLVRLALKSRQQDDRKLLKIYNKYRHQKLSTRIKRREMLFWTRRSPELTGNATLQRLQSKRYPKLVKKTLNCLLLMVTSKKLRFSNVQHLFYLLPYSQWFFHSSYND